MERIETEKRVIGQMIALYCHKTHSAQQRDALGGEPRRRQALCAECAALLEYARMRLDRCPKGNEKRSCRKCTIHCYAPAQRERIRDVMRQVGPLMLFHHPLSALRHLLSEMK